MMLCAARQLTVEDTSLQLAPGVHKGMVHLGAMAIARGFKARADYSLPNSPRIRTTIMLMGRSMMQTGRFQDM